MGDWETFAVIAGGAAGALIGLLFVAVSIRVDTIAASAQLRNRAAQTLGLFTTVLLVSVFLAVPGQPRRLFGAELVVLALVTATALQLLDRRAKTDRTAVSVARLLDTVTPNTVTCSLLAAAGVVLLVGLHAGFYVLVAPVVVAYVGGIVSAWLLLVRLP